VKMFLTNFFARASVRVVPLIVASFKRVIGSRLEISCGRMYLLIRDTLESIVDAIERQSSISGASWLVGLSFLLVV